MAQRGGNANAAAAGGGGGGGNNNAAGGGGQGGGGMNEHVEFTVKVRPRHARLQDPRADLSVPVFCVGVVNT